MFEQQGKCFTCLDILFTQWHCPYHVCRTISFPPSTGFDVCTKCASNFDPEDTLCILNRKRCCPWWMDRRVMSWYVLYLYIFFRLFKCSTLSEDPGGISVFGRAALEAWLPSSSSQSQLSLWNMSHHRIIANPLSESFFFSPRPVFNQSSLWFPTLISF